MIDLGPGAGHDGGRTVFKGPLVGATASDTLTGRHLRERLGAAS